MIRVVQDIPANTGKRRWISGLAFLNRFTGDEFAAFDIASIDVPTEDMAQRIERAKLRTFLIKATKAEYIDLDRPDTRDGVERVAVAGIITAERAAEILDGPIQPIEVYEG